MLWSPHGHEEAVATVAARMIDVMLLDSDDVPGRVRRALARAAEALESAYVVDLAWLRTTPWRERLAASFDPERSGCRAARAERRRSPSRAQLDRRPRCCSPAGWHRGSAGSHPCSRPIAPGRLHGTAGRNGGPHEVIEFEPANMDVPGLAGVTVSCGDGYALSLDRASGGLCATATLSRRRRARLADPRGLAGRGRDPRRGVRQALLRDPTYGPALRGRTGAVSRRDGRDRGRRRSRPGLRGDARRGRGRRRRCRADRRIDAEAGVRRARPARWTPWASTWPRHDVLVRRRARASSPSDERSNYLMVKTIAARSARGWQPARGAADQGRARTRWLGAEDYERAAARGGAAGVRPDAARHWVGRPHRFAVPRPAVAAGAVAAGRRRRDAGLEPFVPRITLTLPALSAGPTGRVPRRPAPPRRTRWRPPSVPTRRPTRACRRRWCRAGGARSPCSSIPMRLSRL